MGRSVAELALAVSERSKRWPIACWYWGDAILVDGLLAVDDAGIAPARDHVVTLLRRWLDTVPLGYHDVLAPGAAISRLVSEGALPGIALERFLGAVDRLPPLFDDTPVLEPHLPRLRFGVCIDAVYHLPSALAAAGIQMGDGLLTRRAIRMAGQTMERLRCTGGFAQWYDMAQDRNNGVPWSRGVGWALLGLLDTLSLVDAASDTADLSALATEILQELEATQRADGNWGPVLGRPDLEVETSVAAFFLAAAHHPQAAGIGLAPDSLAAAEAAVRRAIAGDGIYQGVSADVLPEWDPSSYAKFAVEPSPWGQGAALRALAALDSAHHRPPPAT